MIVSLALHKSWIVFVGTFFLGESVVLASSALAAQGTWSWVAVAAWAFAGTVVSDTVWFHSARVGFGRRPPTNDGRLKAASARLDHMVGAHPHRGLLFIKFIYGTRIASIIYMASKGVVTRRFVAFDALGTVIWLSVLIPIGWAMGLGLDRLGADLRRFEWALLGIVLVASLLKGLKKWRARPRA